MVTFDEARALRDTIEAARKARGADQRPFDYFVRPHTVEPEDVGGFVRSGFENIVLWGPNLWPNDPAISLDTQVAGLERVARDLGVGVRVPEGVD